jgi:hypothetical protein
MFESGMSRAGTLVARRGPPLPTLQQLRPHLALRAAPARSSLPHAPSPAEHVSPVWAPALRFPSPQKMDKKGKGPGSSGPFLFLRLLAASAAYRPWYLPFRVSREGLEVKLQPKLNDAWSTVFGHLAEGRAAACIVNP